MNDKTHSHCLPCEAESYTRNHYFTGKLMVERDFTDEQRYFREKIRLHHQRMHGSGVVCGLKILAHKEPCDNRYVILQPGSAVDCCGQDILVAEQDVIDLFAFPAFQDLIKEAQEVAAENPDATPPSHTLQLCISYKECPTEDIPVLYDECGCDDTQCAPNRILETYAIDLRVDLPLPISPLHQPLLDWNNTLNIAHAVFSILHEATQRLYVLNDEGVIYQISSNNYAIEASFALGREGLAIALDQDGTQLYAVVANSGGTAAGDADLWVFDVTATQLANGPTLSGAIPTSNNSRAQALVTSGNQLLLLFGENSARLKLWNAGVIDPTAPQVEIALPVNLHGLAQGSDGSVYAAQPGSAIIHQFDLSSANLSPATSTDSQAGANLFLVTPIIASGPDFLAVLDAANKRFRVLDHNNSNAIIGNIVLAHEPIDLVISNGGHWAYVLMKDGNDAFIQTINVQALRQGAAVVASIPFQVGDLSQSLVITQNAQKLFVPYIANAMLDDAGGVAAIDLREVNCHELLWPEDCPDCGTADCLVLATIARYTQSGQ
jgi:DNA-binding beta-propeller fold protein YncE